MRQLTSPRRADNAWDHLVEESNVIQVRANNATSLKLMHAYYNRLVTGREDYHYLRYFFDKYFSKRTGLLIGSFGSGGGHLERTLVEMNVPCEKIDGFELNPRLVASSNQKAEELGMSCLQYFEADLNSLNVSHNKYDIGIFFHSLHHVENTKSCLDEVRRALKDDGLLLVVDYVGPNRLQWTDSQLALADKLLHLIPQKYRIHKDLGTTKEKSIRNSIEEVIKQDPSEAVCSEQILSQLRAEFKEIEFKSLEGSVLNHVLNGITHNFNENVESDRNIIRILQNIEEWFEDNKYLPADFIFAVYAKKGYKYQSKNSETLPALIESHEILCDDECETLI